MSYQADAPADKRLMADFFAALEAGDVRTLVNTPAFREKRTPIGDVLGDEAGGDRAEVVLGCLLRTMARALKSSDIDTRVHAMAEAAAMGRLFANRHTEAQILDDADAEDEFQADYADALRLQDKDRASFAVVGA
jgi:hypothetical protein